MKFTQIIVTALFLATSAFAGPLTSHASKSSTPGQTHKDSTSSHTAADTIDEGNIVKDMIITEIQKLPDAEMDKELTALLKKAAAH
ncbi:hypothetical protein TWF694_009225 [Orbilia ellipsospora]|uniref:Uncharacterized protein n=1 Tax=Orbilia ellipsospora TaxID=2528407 RepID=A0AAV9XEA0_9PEZI